MTIGGRQSINKSINKFYSVSGCNKCFGGKKAPKRERRCVCLWEGRCCYFIGGVQ